MNSNTALISDFDTEYSNESVTTWNGEIINEMDMSKCMSATISILKTNKIKTKYQIKTVQAFSNRINNLLKHK